MSSYKYTHCLLCGSDSETSQCSTVTDTLINKIPVREHAVHMAGEKQRLNCIIQSTYWWYEPWMHSSHYETLFSCIDTHLPDSHDSKCRLHLSRLPSKCQDHKDTLKKRSWRYFKENMKWSETKSPSITCKTVHNKGEKQKQIHLMMLKI